MLWLFIYIIARVPKLLIISILCFMPSLRNILASTETLTSSQSSSTSPSRIYTYDDFFESLRSLSVGGIYGNSYHIETNPYTSDESDDQNTNNRPSDEHIYHPSNHAFYISQSEPNSQNAIIYGIVNICAFLANAMVESIQYDSCEEWNGMPTGGNPSHGDNLVFTELNAVHSRYFPMSNACGQFGKLYSDNEDTCFASTGDDGFTNTTTDGMQIDMSCSVDVTLEMEAAIHPKYNHPSNTQQSQGDSSRKYGPPPFYCGSNFNRFSGYWDGYLQEFVGNVAYPSSLGKTNVQG